MTYKCSYSDDPLCRHLCQKDSKESLQKCGIQAGAGAASEPKPDVVPQADLDASRKDVIVNLWSAAADSIKLLKDAVSVDDDAFAAE